MKLIETKTNYKYLTGYLNDANVDNKVISKLIETKNNPKYLIGYLGDIIRPLVLILFKMSGYVKTFKDKNGIIIIRIILIN